MSSNSLLQVKFLGRLFIAINQQYDIFVPSAVVPPYAQHLLRRHTGPAVCTHTRSVHILAKHQEQKRSAFTATTSSEIANFQVYIFQSSKIKKGSRPGSVRLRRYCEQRHILKTRSNTCDRLNFLSGWLDQSHQQVIVTSRCLETGMMQHRHKL